MSPIDDRFDLERFVTAQAAVIDTVRRELAIGSKHTHWMWFVFPQAQGLGRSHAARVYSIRSGEEARAYLGHDVLGPRLLELTRLVLRHPQRPATAIFGDVDALKFRSSMTLFEAFSEDRCFTDALLAFYAGKRCPLTLEWLEVHGA